MRKMKDSGIAWIGEIPEEWEVCKTKQIFSVYNGSTPKSDNAEYWDGSIVWITPAEMGEDIDFINDSKRKLTNLGLSSCGTTVVPLNSIILSSRAPIGQVAIAGSELCTNQGCKSLVKKNNINEKYFYYFFKIQSEPLNMLGKGTTFLELSSFELENFSIPTPSVPEQRRIADYLDAKCAEIDHSMELVREGIDKLKEYKKSVITEAVTKGLDPDVPMKDSGVPWIGEIPEEWELIRLKFIAPVQGGYAFKSDKFSTEHGIPLVRMNNLKEGMLDLEGSVKIQEEDVVEEFFIKENDILIGLSGSIGNYAVASKHDLPCLLNQRVGRFIVLSSINPKLVFYFLDTDFFKQPLLLNSKGTAQFNISPTDIGNVLVPLPPLSVQQAIISYLHAKCAEIDTLITQKQALLDKLAEYKKSLIFECVTGKREVAA